MKVNPLFNNTRGNGTNPMPSQDKTGVGATTPADFTKTLNTATGRSHREDLEYLLEEINKKAEKLIKSRTIQDLKNYKRSVRDFLKETIGRAYKAYDESSWNSSGRPKLLVIIKKVDEKLEELSYEVLREQQNNLQLLNKLDEIRGLLVDIYK